MYVQHVTRFEYNNHGAQAHGIFHLMIKTVSICTACIYICMYMSICMYVNLNWYTSQNDLIGIDGIVWKNIHLSACTYVCTVCMHVCM